MKYPKLGLMMGLFATLSITPFMTPVRAEGNSNAVLAGLLHSSMNKMVTEVRQAADPADKREILGHYLRGMDLGLEKAITDGKLNATDTKTLNGLQVSFHANYCELNGKEGFTQVPDGELDHYAGFLQQSMEQAGNGVYISGGALLVIIIVLLILLL